MMKRGGVTFVGRVAGSLDVEAFRTADVHCLQFTVSS